MTGSTSTVRAAASFSVGAGPARRMVPPRTNQFSTRARVESWATTEKYHAARQRAGTSGGDHERRDVQGSLAGSGGRRWVETWPADGTTAAMALRMRPLGSSFFAAALASVSFVALTTAVGCGNSEATGDSTSTEPEAVSSGSDVTDVESNALTIASSLGGGTGDGNDGLSLASQTTLTGGGSSAASDLTAQALGDAATSYYQPAGCLVVTDDTAASTATYAFHDCTGPHGLVTVDGTINVAYSAPSSTELKLSFSITEPFTITGVKGRQAILDTWAATADITASGADLATRTLDWSGRLVGQTRRGVAFDHSSSWELSWTLGGDCLGESGTSSGTAGKLAVTTTVKDFQVCDDSCPAAGSEITVADSTNHLSYDVTYGTDTATYTGPLGKKYSYEPLCAE